jgi:hypothetical protein
MIPSGVGPPHFVLDHNFPIVAWPLMVRLSRLAEIEPELIRGHDDWEILYALNRRGDVQGFITNDADMLELSREMVALSYSRLTLVITDGVGHDPLRGTGLLMVHLEEIGKRVISRPQIFVLRPGSLRPQRPGQLINKLAERRSVPPNRLIARERDAIREHLIQRPLLQSQPLPSDDLLAEWRDLPGC